MSQSKPKITKIDKEVTLNTAKNRLAKVEADYASASKSFELLKRKSTEQKNKLDKQLLERASKLNSVRADIKIAGDELSDLKALLLKTNNEVDEAVTNGNQQLRDINFEYERIKTLVKEKEAAMADYTNTNDSLYQSIIKKRNEENELNRKYESLNQRYQNILNGMKERIQEEYAKYQTIVKSQREVIERIKNKEREIEDIKLKLMNS
jgi:chromosome segregation ATPase